MTEKGTTIDFCKKKYSKTSTQTTFITSNTKTAKIFYTQFASLTNLIKNLVPLSPNVKIKIKQQCSHSGVAEDGKIIKRKSDEKRTHKLQHFCVLLFIISCCLNLIFIFGNNGTTTFVQL